MTATEVHVSLPAFSRLCLFCTGGSGAAPPGGALEAVLTDPETLSELRRRLAGLDRERPLVGGVCASCRRRLLRYQGLLLQFRAAAAALAAAYRRAAAARRASRVVLRRGRRRAEVAYSTCCRLAADRPASAQPADLLRRLITEAFGAEALDDRVFVSTVGLPSAQDGTGSGQDVPGAELGEDNSGMELGAGAVDRGGVIDVLDEADEVLDGTGDIDSESADSVNRPSQTGDGEVWPTDGAAHLRKTRTNPEAVSAIDAIGSGNRRPGSGSVAENTADDSPAENTASQDSRRKEEASDSDEEHSQDGEDRSDDWRPGRSSRRTGATADPPPRTKPQPRRGACDGRFCHMCRQTFRSQRSLQAHVEKLHKVAGRSGPEEPARVWCPACAVLLPPADVTGHVTRQHGGRLACACCELELGDAAAAARHCVERHTANYMCIVCLQMYSSQDQLISHMNSSHEPPSPGPGAADPVAAVYDDLVRRLRARARRLRLSLLGRTAVRCPYCAQVCSLHYLRTHLYKHRAAGFRCRACDKRFKFPVSFQKHLLLHAGRADKCAQCGAAFTSRSALLSHLRTHSAERHFSCHHCQKRFKFKQTRDAHVRRAHGGGAARVCDVCGAEFRLQYQLTVHLARHSSGRTLRCPLCPRLYELNLDLKRHLYAKHKLRAAEAERRFPEIGRRPNTAQGAAEGRGDAVSPADPDDPREGQQGPVPPSAAPASPAVAAERTGQPPPDEPPPATSSLLTSDGGAAPLEVDRAPTAPPELQLQDGGTPAGPGQVLLLVDRADIGTLVRDVPPNSSGTF